MTRTCCPTCRLRFGRTTAAGLAVCPSCGQRLHPVHDIVEIVGYRLADEAFELNAEVAAAALPSRRPPTATS